MAEIIRTSVINKATELAEKLLLQEWSHLNSLEENMNWIQREMRHIQSYIDDAKARVTQGDLRVKNLIKDIEELAGDADDILDEFIQKMEPRKTKGTIGCLKESITCIFSHPCVAHKVSMKIEKIKTRVADINRVRTTYGITDTTDNNNQHDFSSFDQRKLFLYVDDTDVIGLDDDFNFLKAKLLDQDLRYGVVSIVGMPGLGKTTLAKKLYRHVHDQFKCCALVYVSQKPKLGEILLNIAKQVGLSGDDIEITNLISLLKTKRYVILLDDIWDVKFCNDLKHVLPECDSKVGSRIIVTSRNNSVGRCIGGESSLHILQPLDLDKSFELFIKRTFTLDNNSWESAPPNLKRIGKEIVRRCGGMPLAVVVTAGMLRARERSEHEWNRVLESMGQNECVQILILSYNDLPIKLRPCFLYFGLFPEDYEIPTFDLINMWVAEKFIVASYGIRGEVEDIAEDFLTDLASRNLIQVSRRTFQGRILSCRIHDLLHSLCVSLAEESNFFLTNDNTCSDLSRQRRLASYSGSGDEFFSSYTKIRALLHFSDGYASLTHLKFKFLRVLFVHISKTVYKDVKIPEGIGSLSCLVYLKLKGHDFGIYMPHDIVKLKHLTTIDIEDTKLCIPIDVMEMKQLRHLHLSLYRTGNVFFKERSSSSSSINVALLPNLQTLIWANDEYMKARWFHQWTNLRKLQLSASFSFLMEVFSTHAKVLTKLEFLSLAITGEPNQQDFEQINLSSCNNLLKLRLFGSMKSLNVGALPQNLIKLCLYTSELNMDHITLIKRLPELKILKLDTICFGGDMHQIDLSGANSLPQLEELHIAGKDYPDGLREIVVDQLGAPILNKLRLPKYAWLSLSERLRRLAVYNARYLF